eukprot:m.68469 g.68469  ORF g.68469 m.68469 type:complete len:159 (-) comp11608_c0_seq30:2940-3416(-)
MLTLKIGADDERGLPGALDDDGYAVHDIWIVRDGDVGDTSDDICNFVAMCRQRSVARTLKTPLVSSFAHERLDEGDMFVPWKKYQLPLQLHLLSMELINNTFTESSSNGEGECTAVGVCGVAAASCIKVQLLPHKDKVTYVYTLIIIFNHWVCSVFIS